MSDVAAAIHRDWEQRLRRIALTAGMVLVVATLVPVAIDGSDPRFLWQTARSGDTLLLLVLMITTGVGGLVLGTVGIALTGRALAMVVLGLPALGFQTAVLGLGAGAEPGWQVVFTIAGLTLVATGSLTRSTYWGSLLARLVCTLGVLMTVVAFAAPAGAGPSRLGAAIEGARSAQGLAHFLWIAGLLPLVAGLGGLLSWSPPRGPAGGERVARLAILALPLSALLTQATRVALLGPEVLMPDIFQLLTVPVVAAAWLALAAGGAAWLLRKVETAAA